MTVKETAWLILFLHGILGLIIISILLITQSGWMVLVLFLEVIVLGEWSTRLKCPACKWPVFQKKLRIGDIEIYPWGVPPPNKCANCDISL